MPSHMGIKVLKGLQGQEEAHPHGQQALSPVRQFWHVTAPKSCFSCLTAIEEVCLRGGDLWYIRLVKESASVMLAHPHEQSLENGCIALQV